MVFMEIKEGLYLFPEGKNFSAYGVYLWNWFELGTASAGEMLIEFLDFDFSRLFSIVDKIDSFSGEEIYNAVNELGSNAPTPFLIKLMTDREWARAYDRSPENWGGEYKLSAAKTLKSIISAYQNMFVLADYYCECFGSAEERFDLLHSLDEPFTSMTVEEIISARKPGKDFFKAPNENGYCFPYIRAYRFTDIENYVQFVFLNMMRYNSNFSKCNYCYKFFIPKTKKLTRFCDRVSPENGKTCKEIAPTVYRNEDISSNKILKEYDLALRRNYQRLCRGEERLPEKSGGKDIDPQTYFDWRDHALKVMRLWKEKKISDEEFLKVVGELD